jgi:NADH-quinone oxidoreductase subunit G
MSDQDHPTENIDDTAEDGEAVEPLAADTLVTDPADAAENEQMLEEQTIEATKIAEVIDSSEEIGTSPAPAEPPPVPTITMTIDGAEHHAVPGQLVIDACAAAGTHVPHFCYHPRMTPVGMCRQCLVEVEGPRGTMTVVSCMTPVAEGQVVNTATTSVKRAQEGILELLLINHPLDCPVCDKGGECPLQDQAFSHGPGESRYVEQKRHHEKPIPINELIDLDRERCVLCDRCTRFADEVAGDKLISFISRGNDTQVMTFPDEPFSSYFSGNTAQICPVGALLPRPYRFKARPWDLAQAESTCTTCSVGCRMTVESSRDELVRFQGIDSDPVNWGWLCDRGRFNFESVNSPERLVAPLVRAESGLTETTWSGALSVTAQLIAQAVDSRGPGSIGLIGGARCTNEDAYAWAKLADAVGISRRDPQLGDGLPPELLNLPRATITEAANASTVVVLGPDVKEELPVLFLRLRDAAEKRRSRILEIAPTDTGLTSVCWKSLRHQPGNASTVIAAALADHEISEQLASGDVVVVAGRGNLAESEQAASAALNDLLSGLTALGITAKVLPALRRGNVTGALQLGLGPAEAGLDALSTLRAAADGQLELLILLGADPLADCPDADLARRALAGAGRVVSIDTFISGSTALADVVLAAAAFGEKSGTTTNLEGRVTPLTSKVTTTGTSRPDWMIAVELGLALGHDLGLDSVEDITAAIASEVGAYAGITHRALEADRDGLLALPERAEFPAVPSHSIERNSYDYRLVVSRKLYDSAVSTAMSPSLAPLAPGSSVVVNPADLDRIGVPEGSQVNVIGPKSSVVLVLATNAAVPRGIAWSAFNQAGPSIADVIDSASPVTDVRIERL